MGIRQAPCHPATRGDTCRIVFLSQCECGIKFSIVSLGHQSVPLWHQYPSVGHTIMTSHCYCGITNVNCDNSMLHCAITVLNYDVKVHHHVIRMWIGASHHSALLSVIRMFHCFIPMLNYVFTMHHCAITMPCNDARMCLCAGTMFLLHSASLWHYGELLSHHNATIFNQCSCMTPQCPIRSWTSSEYSVVTS